MKGGGKTFRAQDDHSSQVNMNQMEESTVKKGWAICGKKQLHTRQ